SWAHSRIRGSIPQSIGQLANLTLLGLSYTGVWGTLPSALGNLANLETLWLPGNNLSWTIPNSFSRLSRLSTLELSGNRLSGPIPSILGRLTNLDKMKLSGNRLAGIIPTSLGRLTRLTFIQLLLMSVTLLLPHPTSRSDLKSNQLVGSLPSLKLMKSVRHIDAGYNFLTGTADESLANIHRLCTASNLRLYLEHNCLSNTSVLCGTGQTQRSSSECESLCGTSPDVPYCSGHGVCYWVFEQTGLQCACYEGFTAGTAPATCIPQRST
ncbi:unnamed protein product, partial [Closterium sp. NIES-65]